MKKNGNFFDKISGQKVRFNVYRNQKDSFIYNQKEKTYNFMGDYGLKNVTFS